MTEFDEKVTAIPKDPLAFMWHVTRAHKKWLFFGVFAVSIAQILGTSTPYLFRAIIDTAQNVSAGTADIKTVWMLVLVYPVVIAVMFVGWRVSGFVGLEWASRSNATAYTTLFSYLAHHSHAYFSNRFAGSLSSKISHASEGVQSLFEAFLWSYYSSILALIITTGFMFSTSVLAGALFLGLILLLIPLNIYIARYRRPHVVDFSAQATRARGYAVDAITNISAVRQYARMDEEKRMFNEHIDEMRRLNVKQWRISEWSLLLNNVIIVLFEAVILYITVSLWTKGTITVGQMVMLTTLMMNVQQTLVFIGMSINGFIRRYGEIQEGLNDILVPYDILDDSDAVPLAVSVGKIECRDMTFEYDGVSVFEHFNLTIQPGERIGLVGESGAGEVDVCITPFASARCEIGGDTH